MALTIGSGRPNRPAKGDKTNAKLSQHYRREIKPLTCSFRSAMVREGSRHHLSQSSPDASFRLHSCLARLSQLPLHKDDTHCQTECKDSDSKQNSDKQRTFPQGPNLRFSNAQRILSTSVSAIAKPEDRVTTSVRWHGHFRGVASNCLTEDSPKVGRSLSHVGLSSRDWCRHRGYNPSISCPSRFCSMVPNSPSTNLKKPACIKAQNQAGLLPFSGSGSRSFYGCDGNLLNQYRRCARRQQRT